MSESTELVFIQPETAIEVYTADKGLDPYLAKIKAEVDGFIPDVTTKKGRDAVASMAYKVSQSKTYLDKTGKELVDKLKEQPKLVDAERKRMRDYLDALRDDVRKPLTEWEDAEKNRIAKHEFTMTEMLRTGSNLEELDIAGLSTRLNFFRDIDIVVEVWEEYTAPAAALKDKSIQIIEAAIVKRQAYEAEQAELARLREEAAQREQKEREERIAREAAEAEIRKAAQLAEAEKQRVEAAAQAERDATAKREAEAKAASERRELELQLATEKAQREALEAQRAAEYERERAERQIEADRKERERQAEIAAAELKAREKDKAHKKEVNNAAVAAFTNGGMTEECAKLAVTLIAKKLIPGIAINY